MEVEVMGTEPDVVIIDTDEEVLTTKEKGSNPRKTSVSSPKNVYLSSTSKTIKRRNNPQTKTPTTYKYRSIYIRRVLRIKNIKWTKKSQI